VKDGNALLQQVVMLKEANLELLSQVNELQSKLCDMRHDVAEPVVALPDVGVVRELKMLKDQRATQDAEIKRLVRLLTCSRRT
jgi:hypothetical protein